MVAQLTVIAWQTQSYFAMGTPGVARFSASAGIVVIWGIQIASVGV